jgi:DNA-binding PadR family transcriptional regulator
MPKRRYLHLTDEQRTELEDVRDHHPKAYMREKAAILLKIAHDMSPHQTAQGGGLKPHQPKSIYNWLNRYEVEGVAGLEVKPGRGRKPAFSP